MTPVDVLSASATRSKLVESEFRLGEWTVFPKLNSISSADGRTFHLEPKVMQVLACLAEGAGDGLAPCGGLGIVSKDVLMKTVWTDTFVTDDVLTRSISELRKVFGDDPKRPQFIQTIPKSGYRLLVPAVPVQRPQAATPAGESAPEAQPVLVLQARIAPTSRKTMVIGLLALAVVVTALILVYLDSKPTGVVSANRTMLAVLPFQNLNNDPEHDYYADGLTAEMISQLGRLPSDRLGVIAWSSVQHYKGTRKNEWEIAKELGANYVLEGTVRRSGSQVRITAELIRIGDRSHIWANSYAGNLEDVLSLQNRVAIEIASEIQGRLTPEQQARLGNATPLDPEAYNIYLKGRYSAYQPTALAMEGRIEQFQEAIRRNPKYAPPYVEMAVSYRVLASEGFAPSIPSYSNAQSALKKALELDPNMAEAHYEMGWTQWRGQWDFRSAETHFRRAIELSPGNAQAHAQYSLFLKSTGRLAEAFNEIRTAAFLSPLDAYTQANAGHLLGLMQRYDEAEEYFRKALDLMPNHAYIHLRHAAVLLMRGSNDAAITEFEKAASLSNAQLEKLSWLAYAYASTGHREEAVGLLAQLLRAYREKKQYISPFQIAMVYAGLNDRENTLEWLEEGYTQHDEWMVYLHVYPEFKSLHSDQQFIDLERRVGLVK